MSSPYLTGLFLLIISLTDYLKTGHPVYSLQNMYDLIIQTVKILSGIVYRVEATCSRAFNVLGTVVDEDRVGRTEPVLFAENIEYRRVGLDLVNITRENSAVHVRDKIKDFGSNVHQILKVV